MSRLFLAIIWALGLAAGPAQAADIRKVIVPFNPVQKPASFGDLLNDCANNDLCVQAVDAIGAAIGLAPGTISQSVENARKIGVRFGGSKVGEQWRTNVFAPRGYRICDVQVRVVSAAPVGSDRSPTFAATIQNDTHFELYAFVHKQQFGGGNSWVEAVATVRFANLGSRAERKCHAISGAVYQYRCSQHNGPQCGTLKYGRIPRFP